MRLVVTWPPSEGLPGYLADGVRRGSMLERYNITDQEHDHAAAAARRASYISAELSDNRGPDGEQPVAQVVELSR